MKKYSLSAKKRDVFGRKVKSLRRDGAIPATVYGKNVKSTSLSVEAAAFEKLYAEAGNTGLVELSLDGTVRPVLVHSVQRNPLKGNALHIEFHQVDLKEKVHANVPIELTGEAAAVAQKVGVLLTTLNEVEVEALPTDLPENIRVDVTKLAAVGDELKVSDIPVPSGVTMVTPGEQIVVKVDSLVSKEAEAQAAAEAAAAAAAAAQAAPAEGEAAPAEGEAAEGGEAKPQEATEPEAKPEQKKE